MIRNCWSFVLVRSYAFNSVSIACFYAGVVFADLLIGYVVRCCRRASNDESS